MKLFIDLDNVVYKYAEAHAAEYCAKTNPYPQSRVGFFKELKLYPNAVEVIKKLAGKHDVYFLTAPSIKNLHCWSEKAFSIERDFGEEYLERLVITSNKGLLRKPYDTLNPDNRTMLIDDHNQGGGREEFFVQGDMYWFAGKDADWLKVANFFYV